MLYASYLHAGLLARRAYLHCIHKHHRGLVAEAKSLGLAGGTLDDVPGLALGD